MKFRNTIINKRSATALLSSAVLLGLMPGLAFAQSYPSISGYAAGNNQTTLTISGTNFGATPATVTLDGSLATVVNWSNTGITVDLPANAGPGTLTVTTAAGTAASDTFAGVERGYYTLSQNGAVTAQGGETTYGDLTTIGVSNLSPAIQLVPTPNGGGYWILTQNGSVYAFGNAASFGSVPSSINAVGMAVLPSGAGAYVLSSTGKVYPLGQAANYGSPTQTIQAAAIATTSDGQGYWILASNGTVYPFGDAANLGSASIPTANVTYPDGTLVRVANTQPVFLVQNGTLHHIPNLTILETMGLSLSQVKVVPNLNGYQIGLPLVVPYPDGTVLDPQGSSTVYLVQNGVLKPITSSTVFNGLGLDPKNVYIIPGLKPWWPMGPTITSVTRSAASHIPNGTLYRVASQPAVYVVENGVLRHITSPLVFRRMGFQWSHIDVAGQLPPLPVGSPLFAPVPIVTNGALYRVNTSQAIYLDQNGILRHIPSFGLFRALGYTRSAVHVVAVLPRLSIGADLGSTTIPSGAPNPPVTTAVDLVPTPDNQGYWVLMANGQVDSIGNAPSLGSVPASTLGSNRAVQLVATPDGSGYTVLTSNGTLISFGDALAGGLSSGAVSLAMSPVPTATVSTTPPPTTTTPSGTGFMSMAYGSFMPNYDTSYNDLVNNPTGLSAIIPTWYYPMESPTTLQWSIGTPPTGYSSVVATAHAEGVQVWPMIGSTSAAPFVNASAITSTVNQIVAAVQNNGYDGIVIDFEPSSFDGLSFAQVSQQYTNFVAQLGPALHAIGKKLMVDTYASSYPNSPFNWPAIAPYVDYINIMSYGEFDSYTEAGPTQGLGWDASVYQSAINDGVSPSQLIMGMGPYGDYWSFNNSGLDRNTTLGNDSYVSDAQVQQLAQQNPAALNNAVWDPAYGSEVFMTNEYVNSSGTWTANSSGSAVAPTHTFTTADENTMLLGVQNLQGLLNFILMRYAVMNNQPVPTYLNLAQDGYYGPMTAEAVTQFQQDFNVANATPGVYGPSTEAALTQVIQQWNIGEYQYWVDTTQSLQNRIQQVALPDQLGGIALWRLPFESTGTPSGTAPSWADNNFWTALESTVTINPVGN